MADNFQEMNDRELSEWTARAVFQNSLMLSRLLSVLDEFRPMLDRYKMAGQANSRLGARKVLKGK